MIVQACPPKLYAKGDSSSSVSSGLSLPDFPYVKLSDDRLCPVLSNKKRTRQIEVPNWHLNRRESKVANCDLKSLEANNII